MSLYDLPKFNIPEIKIFKSKEKASKFCQNKTFSLILVILVSFIFGGIGGFFGASYFYQHYLEELYSGVSVVEKTIEKYEPQTSQEELIIRVVEEAFPSVVSIIVTKDLPVFEQYYYNPFEGFEKFFGQPFEFQVPDYRQKGTEKKEIGGGTGFVVSENGMILTNRHVVIDKDADYTVLTNDGKKYQAKILGRDPIQDLAIIKIELEEKLRPLKLGDSDNLQVGQSVIAIGNALGEFRNTVSVGVVSGLKRTVVASGQGISEILENIIQTDAAINKGNSGGPLLNLKGEVVGVNVAMAQIAENIGFTIPINAAKKDIEQIKTLGKIVYPFLGVRYIIITEDIQKKYNLSVDYGAWLVRGEEPKDVAVIPDSAADKVGLKENDIILEFNDEEISAKNSLAIIIQKYNPGDDITLKVLSQGKEKIINVRLGEKSE